MKNDNSAYEILFKAIMEVAPGFRPIYEDHKRYYEELLPHVLMGDLTRYIIKEFCMNNCRDLPYYITQILSILDREVVSKNPDISNLIAVSFVENLQGEEMAESIYKHFGQNLKSIIHEIKK